MTDHTAQPWTTTQPKLTHHLRIDPDQPIENWRLQLPGKGACYLFSDGDDRPVLLSTVGNLRLAVERRMAGLDDDQPTKRIDYRQVVRKISWRPTFSRFEANWVYLENARHLVPDEYQRWLKTWHGHWLHVDPTDPHPRWLAKHRPAATDGCWLGPLPDGSSARRYIDLLEDLFDLCRHHDILTQAPHGKACAYKEMGKCPAPCDGSIPLDAYRRMIEQSIAFATGSLDDWLADRQQQMQSAAAELDFERAGQIKQQIARADTAAAPAYRHMHPLDQFRFVLIQSGSGKHKRRLFYINPATIHFLGEMLPKHREKQIAWAIVQIKQLERAYDKTPAQVTSERMGLVAWHLLRGREDDGVFVPVDQVTPDKLLDKHPTR